MVDEFALRDAAKDLLKLYVGLDAAKFSSNQPRGERTMRPAPGPRPPAPDAIISLDEELASRLFEMVSEVRNHIRPTLIMTKSGPRLCSFLAWNAQAVSELDVAPDLLEEIRDQARQIARFIHPPSTAEVAKQDPYLTADSIQRSLAAQSLVCPEGTIRRWASEGHVKTKTRRDRKRAYSLGDVIHMLKKRKDTDQE